jgi:hypothetical protein
MRKSFAALCVAHLLVWNVTAAAQSSTPTPIITTIAGSGRPFIGNNGPATDASFGQLSGLAIDSKGNLYVCDLDHNIVVRIAPTGTATIFAGNGKNVLAGDGGPATQASLARPRAVVCDAQDNVYIADLENNRIRKVSTTGTITTIAGGGPDVNMTPVEGVAATSTFISPNGLAIDAAGNLYTSDGNHARVRKIRTDGTVVTVAGNGVGGFSGDGGPATSASIGGTVGVVEGLAVDASGNVYMADVNRIRKVDPQGIIHTIAGSDTHGYSGDGGPAVNALLGQPLALLADSNGNLLIDGGNNVVRRISPTGIIDTIVGAGAFGFSGDGGPAKSATFKNTWGIALDHNGNTFVCDSQSFRVRKIDSSGTITTIAGNGKSNFSGDGGSATAATLDKPLMVALDGKNNLYIADSGNNRIRKVTPDGVISTFAGNGVGGFSGDGGPATAAMMNNPTSVAVDGANNVYVADEQNNRVRKVDANGRISTYAGTGDGGIGGGVNGDGGPAVNAAISSISSIATDPAGNLYIADRGNSRIRKVNTAGVITTVAGNGQEAYSGDGGPATSASLTGVFAVSTARDGSFYISSFGRPAQIRKVDPQGIITRFFGDFGEASARGIDIGDVATQVTVETPVTVIPDQGGITYVASFGYSAIYKVAPDGTITYLAGYHGGGAQGGFGGDGGPAIAALLGPGGIAVDSTGDVYIADTGSDRIRKVTLNPVGLVGNVSTRLPVGTDENVLIEGFIVQGPAGSAKKILVRAIGPSLGPFGINDALSNPSLEIHDSNNAIVATNNDWKTTQVGGLITGDQSGQIATSQLAPTNDLESAIIADLAPGAYTALVRGAGNSTGTGVVDAYDISAASPAKLANIATRGFIQPGDKLMIAGFIVQNGTVKAVVRAIGPSLSAFGITNALPDTTLQVRDQNGGIVLENDDWQTSQKQELESIGLQPSHNLEAALIVTLQPGQYTAQVRGKNGASGIGVVQVYFIP